MRSTWHLEQRAQLGFAAVPARTRSLLDVPSFGTNGYKSINGRWRP